MKRYIFFLIVLLVTGIVNAQNLRVESSTDMGIRLHYSLPKINMSDGLPGLPIESQYIAIPKGATINVDVQEQGSRSLSGIDLSRISETIVGAAMPDSNVVTVKPTTIRGLDVVQLTITPYRYDPMKKALDFVQDIDVDIRFEGGNGQFGDSRYLNPDWEHILRNLILNKEMLPKSNYYSLLNSINDKDGDAGCEYLIISPDNAEILAWADTLKAFRTKQGILTKVATLTECGGNNTTSIRNYILNAYNTWEIPPAAVLLFGGYYNGSGIVPFYHYTIEDEYPSYRYPTDYPYCDMNGDSLPDLAISRITARNAEEYRTFVTKTIQYENNPYTDEGYYDHPIITSGYEDVKWFVLSSQSIDGFYRHKLGKNPANYYMLKVTSVDPPDSVWSTGYNTPLLLDYFGPNGQQYIPELIGDLHEWITKTDTVPLHAALNEGSFLTLYRGHSNFDAWWFPPFNTTSLGTLTGDKLTFLFSISCSTGTFARADRGLVESFCLREHGGAVGGIGAASLTYSFFNDILAWGIYDCIWPNFLPGMGGDTPPEFVRPSYALADAKIYFDYHFFLPDLWINKENSTRHLFGYIGETYLNLFTEIPQHLQITHDQCLTSDANAFSVTAEEGAVVCLSKDDEIIGVQQSNGQACTFDLSDLTEGERIIITATKQNHFRYECEVPVISNQGQYVVVDNDGWLTGNDCVDIRLHNYGNDEAEHVTMSLYCESPYIEIIQGECQAQNVAPGQTVTVNNAFRFDIADDIPDMTEVVFNVMVDDGNGVKECAITQQIAAPALEIEPEITYENSNHQTVLQLESSGRTDLHVKIANKGHRDSDPVNVYLEISAPFITIDNPSRTFNSIGQESVRDVVFSIDAQNSFIDEGWLMTRITLDDGVNQCIIDTLLPFGGFNEAFDPEHFNAQDWQFAGNEPWILTDDESHSDRYSAISGEIGNSQSSSISITRETQATEISFVRKVSSEFNYDKLHFYIDNQDMGEWSGSRSWSEERYPLTRGTHTFRWTYAKDNSVSLGHDCAWIDDVNIDPKQNTIAYSGGTLTVCRNESVHLDCSYAYNYHNLTWITSGDGYFDDTHALHPEYFPGLQDINNGGATLQLQADDIVSPLQLILTDEISLGSAISGYDYINPGTTVFNHYTVESQDGITYLWHLEPEEAGRIFAHGPEADVVWSFVSGITEATLTVTADASCSQSLSKTIQIGTLDIEEQAVSPFRVFPNPTNGIINICFDETMQETALVEVFNMLGERVVVKNVRPLPDGESVSIDLSQKVAGLYIVQISTKKGSFSQKVSLR